MFRHRHLIIAIILALVGTRLTGGYIRRLEQQATGLGPRTQVVIAKTVVPKGTEMQASLVESQMWPTTMVPEGAIARPDEVKGLFACVDLVPGEVILADRLVDQGEQNLAWQLSSGERAVAVSVSSIGGLEAELTPGSRVDILGTLLDYRTGLEHSLMVLTDIRLLDVATEEEPYGNALGKQTVILAVSPHEAKKLALFDSRGSLRLLLRPPTSDESHTGYESALTTKDIFGPEETKRKQDILAPTLTQALPVTEQVVAADSATTDVEIIRGTVTSFESPSTL